MPACLSACLPVCLSISEIFLILHYSALFLQFKTWFVKFPFQILKKMYDEDLDEFSEEVKRLMEQDAKKSQETVSPITALFFLLI